MGSSVMPLPRNHSSAKTATQLSGNEGRALPHADGDDQLMERISGGDEVAFAMLLKRHNGRFYRVAYRYVGNRTEAEDIVQEAFLRIWSKPFLWQVGRNTAFTTWFYRIVVNLCFDHKKKKRPSLLEDDSYVEDDRDSQEAVMIADQKQRWLAEQIAALPDRQRMALNLCFYEELSNKDAANAMGIRLGALESLLIRAKSTIKYALKKHYEDML